ncbi:MAG TPA: hypothetical protein VJN02_12940 [Gammaproteobacteria bacterium]|nr:hypothetical protein [Gammaproteobacteria bacterium]
MWFDYYIKVVAVYWELRNMGVQDNIIEDKKNYILNICKGSLKPDKIAKIVMEAR